MWPNSALATFLPDPVAAIIVWPAPPPVPVSVKEKLTGAASPSSPHSRNPLVIAPSPLAKKLRSSTANHRFSSSTPQLTTPSPINGAPTLVLFPAIAFAPSLSPLHPKPPPRWWLVAAALRAHHWPLPTTLPLSLACGEDRPAPLSILEPPRWSSVAGVAHECECRRAHSPSLAWVHGGLVDWPLV
jgi:hypothetical protein